MERQRRTHFEEKRDQVIQGCLEYKNRAALQNTPLIVPPAT